MTSSATNVGADKDSAKRQMAAINAYARVALFEIVLPPYYDAAVSGADPIDARPGFRALLTYLAEHPDVRAILVENASMRRTTSPTRHQRGPWFCKSWAP